MDVNLTSAILQQTKLLEQIAADIAAIKTVVLREAKPVTAAQQAAEVEALNRRIQAPRTKPKT